MSKQKKYHFIYKTTCKITGKFYVGMHSTDNLDDGYIGSGKILGYSRKKYGDENHQIERLEFVSSRDELKQREKEIVNEELLKHPLNINLKYGGEGGWDHIAASVNYAAQMKKAGENGYFSNKKKWPGLVQKAKENATLVCRPKMMKRWQDDNAKMLSYQSKAVKNASTDIAIAKRKETFANREHQQGEKNSQYGTCWVNNGVEPVKIKKEQLDEYFNKGYSLGRKVKCLDSLLVRTSSLQVEESGA